MTRRLLGIALWMLSAVAAASAADAAADAALAAAIARLPEVIARRGDAVVRRAEVEPALRQEPLRSHLTAHPDELTPTVTRFAEQKIGLEILRAVLRRRGIAVDGANARRYIERHTRRFGGSPAAQRLRLQLEKLVDTPQFQFKAALHRCFEETAPRAVEVTDEELERIYRLDQKRFLRPEKLDCGVIAVRRDRGNAQAIAESAAARLRQGEAFERVAAEIDPEGAGNAVPPLEKLAKLAEGEVVIIPGEGMFRVVMLRRRIPASYIPFAEVAPFLAEELAAARVSRAMEQLLAAELAVEPIRFAPELRSGR